MFKLLKKEQLQEKSVRKINLKPKLRKRQQKVLNLIILKAQEDIKRN